MVSPLTKLNREEIIAVYEVYKENFKTRQAIFMNTVLLLLVESLWVCTEKNDSKPIVYNDYANCYSTKTLVFEIYQISHSMIRNSESQGAFKSSIEDITYTSKLISLKQLDKFFYGKRNRCYVTKLLTTLGSSLQCESYGWNFQQKLRRLN